MMWFDFKRKLVPVLCGLALLSLMCGTAAADVITFDLAPNLAPGNSPDEPGQWYIDRYEPAGFSREFFDGDNRLRVDISGADQQSNSFYNNQGRKRDFGDNMLTYSIFADFYVDPNWEETNPDVSAGVWGTGLDSNGDPTAYAIIAWRQGSFVDTPGFYAYDYETSDGTSGYRFMASYDEVGSGWHRLKIDFDGTSMNHYIDDVLYFSLADNTQQSNNIWGNIIVNTYNFGQDQVVYWDNIGTGYETPEPASMLLFGSGMAGLAYLRRRRKKRS